MKSHLVRKSARNRRQTRLRIEGLEDRCNPVLVTPALAPTPTDNDYTRIQNAVNAAVNSDTIELSGTFNFTEANAAASWALGSDGLASTFDDYSVYVPGGATGVTIMATALGNATIQGPGDLPELDLESFLYFEDDSTGYQGWTVSNLVILDFDLSIGMFTDNEFLGAFEDVTITNNRIRIATDRNGVSNPFDGLQNVGIHYAYGKNQTISDNQIEIPGNGVSNSSATEGDLFANTHKFATSVGIQSRNAAGDLVDNLVISGNTITVLNAQSAFPERVIGIWENTTAHRSNITVSNNQFLSNAPGNNPGLNRNQAFWVTSHSNSTGLGTTVTYSGNTVSGAALGFRFTSDYDYSLDPANTAVRFVGNTLTNVSSGFLIQNGGKAYLTDNTLTGVGVGPGAGIGVTLRIGSSLDIDAVIGANEISGFGRGLELAGNARVDGAIITGNASGILAVGGNTLIQNSDLQNNTAVGLQVQDGAIVDAGQVLTVDYTPIDFTGLGISVGNNSFLTGYSATGALAIVNANTGVNYNTIGPDGFPFDVTAHGNFFGDIAASYIESVVRHDFDDPLLGYVDIASAFSYADLGITAEFVTAPAFVDQRLTLLVKVTNFGPSATSDVVVTANVPANTTFVSVAVPQGTASQLAGVVTAQLGSIASGATVIVRIVVEVDAAVPLTSTATVSAAPAPSDPNALNNSATANVTAVDTPGGVVKAIRYFGRLVLVGDAVENAVQVVAGPAPNSYTVIGLGGTQIKFGTTTGPTATLTNIKNGIGGNLLLGNDTLIIDGSGTNNRLAITGSVGGNLTRGDDVMYALHVAATKGFSAGGGAGVNRVRVTESTFGGNVVFNGNAGNDIFQVSETSTTAHLIAKGGADADQITIDRATVGRNLVWNAGAGDDILNLTDTVVSRVTTLLGYNGLDTAIIARSTFNNRFTWNGGNGNDSLSTTDVNFNKAFRSFGLAGDDAVTALRTSFFNTARFDGGIGLLDTLNVGSLAIPPGSSMANSFAQTPVVLRFENILS